MATGRHRTAWEGGGEHRSEEGGPRSSLGGCFGKNMRCLAATKPMTGCRPANEAAPLPAVPSLTPPACAVFSHPVFWGSVKQINAWRQSAYLPLPGRSRGKKAYLFIWKRYRAVAQLARNRHILGEILSAKPGGAHPQQIPSWLPDPVPLDSSKQKGKVLPRVFARKMHIPASLSLESLAGG